MLNQISQSYSLKNIFKDKQIKSNKINIKKEKTKNINDKYKKTKVALINFDNSNENTLKIITQLYKAEQKKSIKAILFYVNCHGGRGGGFNQIYNAISEIKKTKPVISLIEISATSGGYLAICSSSHIIASEMSEIGSIGALRIVEKHTDSELTGIGGNTYKAKVNYIFVTSGKYKALGHPNKPISDEELDELHKSTYSAYSIFCSLVSKARNLNLDEKNIWAEGQIFNAPQALNLGLIDSIGGLYETIEKIKILINKCNSNLKTTNKIKFVDFTPNNQTLNKKS